MGGSFCALIAGTAGPELELISGRPQQRGVPYFCVPPFSISADCAPIAFSSEYRSAVGLYTPTALLSYRMERAVIEAVSGTSS